MEQLSKANNVYQIKLPSLSQREFLHLCKKFLRIAFDETIETQMKTDLPIDALHKSDGRLFKILPPLSIYDARLTLKNDIEQIKKIVPPINSIIYLTQSKFSNDKLKKEYAIKKTNKGNIHIDIISQQQILLTTSPLDKKTSLDDKVLSQDEITNLFEDRYSVTPHTNTILAKIFSYISSKAELDEYYFPAIEEDYENLRIKISCNFAQKKDREYVIDSYKNLWATKALVEEFIQNNFEKNPIQFTWIYHAVQNIYKEEKQINHVGFPINYPSLFRTLAKKLVPPFGQNDPIYEILAEAIIMYFFEYCDIGKKFENEQPSFFLIKN